MIVHIDLEIDTQKLRFLRVLRKLNLISDKTYLCVAHDLMVHGSAVRGAIWSAKSIPSGLAPISRGLSDSQESSDD